MSLPRNLLFFIAVASPLIAAKAQTSLVPTSPQWHPNEILNWNPATDPSAPYARSTVPLATRISVPTAAQNAGLNALWNVNTHARPNEGRIQTVISFNSIPAGGAQGWRTTKLYAPTFWQYNENMVFWGSSDRDTRVILAPTAHVIDAAHRNGVPVYGKIFFGWNGSPDNASLQRIRDLLQKQAALFPSPISSSTSRSTMGSTVGSSIRRITRRTRPTRRTCATSSSISASEPPRGSAESPHLVVRCDGGERLALVPERIHHIERRLHEAAQRHAGGSRDVPQFLVVGR